MASILLFSDIHSNLAALMATLGCALFENEKISFEELAKRLEKEEYGYDRILNLGDVVGYGNYPNEVIELLKMIRGLESVAGNHDEAVLEVLDGKPVLIHDFNGDAQASIENTAEQLNPSSIGWLRALKHNEKIKRECTGKNFSAFHSGPGKYLHKYITFPRDRGMPERLNQMFYTPQQALEECDAANVFVGHTHLIGMYRSVDGRVVRNIGSVGATREDVKTPFYAVFDTEKNTGILVKVRYNLI